MPRLLPGSLYLLCLLEPMIKLGPVTCLYLPDNLILLLGGARGKDAHLPNFEEAMEPT